MLLRSGAAARRLSGDLESARRDWAEGHRRLASAAGDLPEAERLQHQVEVVMEELRRRVGGTFTLADLARAYDGAERWARAAVEERAGAPGWPRTLAVAVDAAFHVYARGAVDYGP